jgi:phage terminase large subunit GpA-like protein
MDLSEWSEKYRVLSGAGTNEKGMWRNARTPYLVEIMKELSPQSRTKEVVVMKGIQLGFSEIAVSWSFYNMHLRPGPFLYMMPSEDMAYKLSKQRLSPSLEQCEVLRDKLNKKTGNSYLEKLFNGGFLVLMGGQSANAYSSLPIRDIVLDEYDRFPVSASKEGDPFALIKNRQTTFPTGKIFCLSSPTITETSLIWALYQESDQRVYMVPCPHCSGYKHDSYFEMKFEQLQWDKS